MRVYLRAGSARFGRFILQLESKILTALELHKKFFSVSWPTSSVHGLRC